MDGITKQVENVHETNPCMLIITNIKEFYKNNADMYEVVKYTSQQFTPLSK